MKNKETLKEYEAALIKFPEYNQFSERIAFEAGAKWQQDKNKYSEEDMRKAIQETITLMRYKATEFREHENTVIEKFKNK